MSPVGRGRPKMLEGLLRTSGREGHPRKFSTMATGQVGRDRSRNKDPKSPLGGVDTYRVHNMMAARVTTAR
jgi:hypothetical protein